jgi:DNA primase
MARKFGIGHFSGRGMMHNRILFEIHNEKGELVAYAGRVLDDSEPRYQFPPGFHKSRELYNLHRVIGETNRRRRVVLVEGFFPCLSVANIGFPCVALMGNTMSKEQEEPIIRYFDVACILLDSNDVGRKGSGDCLARLGRRMYAYAPLLPEGMQLDTMTPEARYAVIKR